MNKISPAQSSYDKKRHTLVSHMNKSHPPLYPSSTPTSHLQTPIYCTKHTSPCTIQTYKRLQGLPSAPTIRKHDIYKPLYPTTHASKDPFSHLHKHRLQAPSSSPTHPPPLLLFLPKSSEARTHHRYRSTATNPSSQPPEFEARQRRRQWQRRADWFPPATTPARTACWHVHHPCHRTLLCVSPTPSESVLSCPVLKPCEDLGLRSAEPTISACVCVSNAWCSTNEKKVFDMSWQDLAQAGENKKMWHYA